MIGRESYALRLAVAVRSLTDNLGPHRTLALTIIEDGVSAETKRRLHASWDLSRTDVEWVDVTRGGRVHLPSVSGLAPIYLVRLFCTAYVDRDVDRIVALDPDVLVVADVGRLWELPLNGRTVLATRDPFVPTVGHPDGVAAWRDAGLSAAAPYLNAAVMLLDLDRWRDDNVSSAAARFIDAHARTIRFGDQDVLNAVLTGRWGELDLRWQVHPRILNHPRLARQYVDRERLVQLSRDPWIYHFGGRLKPWVYPARQPADLLFFTYLDRTEWRGWRPQPSLRGWLYRLYDSPLRGWVHPLEVQASAALRALAHVKPRRSPAGRGA
jgi:lipopolysaccharide biosynthesis glycosyltransferase